ncbi:MAG: S-layer homology domain-containing protein [Oscillospiraceae bacterium]|nr:S-layer homology domain-containing protein [Oscillospiraceae bacterium]
MKSNTRRFTAILLAVLMLAALAVPALALDAIDYDGDEVTFIKEDGSAFGMFAPQEGTTCAIDGDNVVIHYVPKNKTVYNGIHFGAIDDAELTKDVEFAEDGTFDITLPKTDCGKAIPIAPIKASDGTTSSAQYYLAIPAEAKLAAPEAPAETGVELAITNNLSMFKAVSASLVETENGEFIVFALSGTGYKNLFKGTYEQAVENGDATGNWIAGAENADGKLEFRVPVAPDQTEVPVVAISNSYYEKYLAGENALARAFYPRMLTLDREAKTLVTDDYSSSVELAVTNNVKMFKVDSAALETVGGPNSNGYKAAIALVMGSDSFDKAFVGKGADIAEDSAILDIDAETRLVELPVKYVAEFGKPETLVSLAGKPFVVSFHSVKKDAWYDRLFTLDEAAATLTIDEVPAVTFTDVPDGQYFTEAVAWAVDKGITTGTSDTTFEPDQTCNRGQVVTFLWRVAGKPAAEAANPFTDVAEGSFYYDAVLWAVANGITTGTSDTTFSPAEPCTRGQVVTFLWRELK